MPKGLYIGSTGAYAGKTMVSIGIGMHLQKEGINFGYMRPVTIDNDDSDEISCFIQEVFGLEEPQEIVTPARLTQDYRIRAFNEDAEDLFPAIQKSYSELSQRKETVLLTGSGHYFDGVYCGMNSARIIKDLDLQAVIIDRVSHEANYDLLLGIKEQLGANMIGTILNDVPASFIPEIEGLIKPFLEKRGIKVLGVIPSDPVMRSIKVKDLAGHIGGRLVAAQNNTDKMVENFLIGTMQVENFMTYFRRQQNVAVIVGGDRADVQLVAIEGECPCLILTGNLFPNDIILSRAEVLRVPIIMVRGDTYSVAHRVESLLSRYKMRDVIKVRQSSQLVDSALDFASIKKAIGIPC